MSPRELSSRSSLEPVERLGSRRLRAYDRYQMTLKELNVEIIRLWSLPAADRPPQRAIARAAGIDVAAVSRLLTKQDAHE